MNISDKMTYVCTVQQIDEELKKKNSWTKISLPENVDRKSEWNCLNQYKVFFCCDKGVSRINRIIYPPLPLKILPEIFFTE